jgi:hypothetical protein
VAIRSGRITVMGDDGDILPEVGRHTQVVDALGRAVRPPRPPATRGATPAKTGGRPARCSSKHSTSVPNRLGSKSV